MKATKMIQARYFLFVVLIMLVTTISAQIPSTILFIGQLADMEGNFIANEKCNIQFFITNTDENKLFESEGEVDTDGLGTFNYILKNLPSLFSSNEKREMLVFNIIIRPDSAAHWMDEDKFLIKYQMERVAPGDFQITRFEGQKLASNLSNEVWEFQDQYPLAYLSSRFIISFRSDITDPDSLVSIFAINSDSIEHINAPADQENAKSRGVKGGFAVGGYRSDE